MEEPSTPESKSPEIPETEEDTFQYDKGLRAWCQVIASHLLVFNGFGYFSAFGLYQSHWQTALGRSSSDISWIGSLQLCLIFLIGTLSGRAMDAGYFRALLISGCAMQIIGMFGSSFANQYWQLVLSQGILQGLGNGVLFTPLVALVAVYFKKKRAFALGLAASGAPIGGVIFPLISRQLEPHLSFAWIIRVMAFLVLFNMAIIFVLARPRKLKKASGPWVEWAAFRELPYALFAAGIALCLWGVYTAYFYTATFGRTVIGISERDSLTMIIILNGVGVLGRLIPALIADLFFGPFNTLLPATFAAGILLLCWIAVDTLPGFTALVAIYGVAANAFQTLFPSTLASLTTDMSKMGVRTGMVFTVGSLFCLTGAPIAGVLIGLDHGGYLYMQLFSGITVLLGAALLLASRLNQTRHSIEVRPE